MNTRLSLTARQAREWGNIHPMLQKVVLACLREWPVATMEVSCIYRTEAENVAAGARTKVHVTKPHRAVDLRIRTLPGDFQAKAYAVQDAVRPLFRYDPSRPHLQVVTAKPHGTGPHIHCQVHPKTAKA